MAKAFQPPPAFQSGYPGIAAFQAFDRNVSIGIGSSSSLEVYMGLAINIEINDMIGIPILEQGSFVVIRAYVKDPSVTPHVPVNPSSIVVSSIKPDGTVYFTEQAMTLQSVGRYIYTKQISVSDIPGAYQIFVKAVSGGVTFITLPAVGFVVA